MGIFFFLWQGVRGLAHEAAARSDWVLTEASIVAITPVQSGARFNWRYLYTFQTADGQSVSGSITEDNRTAFYIGQRIPVRYLRSAPTENGYALDKMPKAILYWFLVTLGFLWVYAAAKPFYQRITIYRDLRAFARQGQAVPGAIIAVRYPPARTNSTEVTVTYTFTPPTGGHRNEQSALPLRYLIDDPQPGTIVAVWWAQDGRACLL